MKLQKLNDAVKAKILGVKVNNEAYLELFEAIMADAQIRELPAATCVVCLYDEGDLQPGEFAPELHFVVRKVAEPEPEQEDND